MYSQTMQKRVDKQKEHANKNLTSWFMKKFSKKTQYIRDQDEESAQAERARRSGHSNLSTKPRHISAVASHQNNHNNSHHNEKPNPQRQRSFLRAQLLEMKRESAETLLQTQQKRMAGEVIDEVPRFGTQLGLDASDDDYDFDESEDDDLDSVHAVDEIDDALVEMTPAEFKAIRKEKWQLKQQKLMDAAVATGKHMDRRRSSGASSSARTTGDDDDDHDKENDGAQAIELNRRISRATQLYAEAINQIEHALHPDDHPAPISEPQPLFLGGGSGKKGSNRVKSEWI